MRYSLLALACLLMCWNTTFAQKKTRSDKPLTDRQKVEVADQLMEAGSYYNATDLYKEVYEADPGPDLAYKLAESYFLSRDYTMAEKWYKTAWDEAAASYPLAQYRLALSMKMNGNYEEAAKEFKSFSRGTKMRGAEATVYKKLARNEQKGCDLALLLMNEPLNLEIKVLNSNVNAAYTDFSPQVTGEKEMIYSSLRTDSVIRMEGNKKTDLRSQFYRSRKVGDQWMKSELMDGPFNETSAHVGNGSYSPDGKRFYYTQCNPDESMKMICEIYMSTFDGEKWGNPEKVKGINDGKYTTTHPTVGVNKGKETLYFSSDRDGGIGGMDIWFSEITNDGKDYSSPRNAGRKLNTVGDESTPFYNVEEDKLYFSSNGHVNIGGYDIYRVKGYERSWSNPENVGVPLNSSVDDLYYVSSSDGNTGFLVSNRPGGIALKSETCCDDIWEFAYILPPEFAIMGNVYSSADGSKIPLDGAFIQLMKSADNAKVDSTVSVEDEMYNFFLGTNFDNFRIRADKQGYTGGDATVSTVGLETSDTLYVDLYITPIDTQREIVVKNIYYELDKAALRPESKLGIDSLYNILVANPNIQIELSSHTDSRGSNEYNIDLSQRRAESVVRYLIDEKGIEASRLVPRGYGETRLLNECADGVNCSEEQHQLNRRTEFRIIGEMPGYHVTYDKAELDGMKALERERIARERQIKIEELMQLEDVGEDLKQIREEVTPETPVSNKPAPGKPVAPKPAPVDTKPAENTAAAAQLNPTLIKKGTMYQGQAMVNGVKEETYMIDPRVPVVFISPDLFMELRAAGTIDDSDFINDASITLSDGTTTKGDILNLKSLQLGEAMLTKVETKINTRMTRSLVVGIKAIEAQGCKLDVKKMQITCKK